MTCKKSITYKDTQDYSNDLNLIQNIEMPLYNAEEELALWVQFTVKAIETEGKVMVI